ncbi:MAG: hypothetical protein LRZ97_02075 [Candidatus Pacebacteria bacterium]|nr:hypothetical protein [Candidatus Paceibacterota bacterium]
MKVKTYPTIALGAIIALGSVGVASAEVTSIKDIKQERNEWRKELQQERGNLRQGYQETRAEARKIMEQRKVKAVEYKDNLKTDVKAYQANIKAKIKAATTDEERQAIKDEARAKATEKRAEVKRDRTTFQAKNKELRSEFRDKAKDRLKARLIHISKRLDSALSRFNQLTDRIQTYLDKKAERGVDIAEAQAALDASVVIKDEAKAKVATVKESIRVILASDTPKEEIEGLRALIKDAAKSIREANNAMKKAIRLAKGLPRPTPAPVTTGVDSTEGNDANDDTNE